MITVDTWADLVYTRRGKVAHVLPFSAGYGTYGGHRISDGEALCLRSPSIWDEWRGTGSQAEAEKARGLPLCARCEELSQGRTR